MLTYLFFVATSIPMELEWDENKRESNLAKHGLDFADAEDMLAGKAVITADKRKEYGESRYNALGVLEGRIVHLTFAVRKGVIRPISFRKANDRERRRYEREV